jgi:TPR repeat protein
MAKPDVALSWKAPTAVLGILGVIATLIVGYWQYVYKPKAQSSTLSGRIFKHGGEGISNARILVSLSEQPAITKFSRSDGAFYFSDLPSFSGTLTVSADGYQPYIEDLAPDLSKRSLEIELRPTQEPTPNSTLISPQSSPSNSRYEANTGWAYEIGQNGPVDYAQAMRWYQKAVQDGDTLAYWNIGRLYEFGFGVPKDFAKATEFYQKAVDARVPRAAEWLQNIGHNTPYDGPNAENGNSNSHKSSESKTGNATTNGAQSPALTGSGNKVTYGDNREKSDKPKSEDDPQ